MLYASSRSDFGDHHMQTYLAVGREFRVFAAERKGLRSDTEYLPTSSKQPRNVSQLWFLIEGTLVVSRDARSVPIVGPSLVVLPEHWDKGADGRAPVRLQTYGDRIRAVHVHYRGAVVDFAVLPFTGELLREVSRYHEAVMKAEAPRELGAAERIFFGVLASAGLVPSAVEKEALSCSGQAHLMRVWNVMREMYAELDTNPSLKVIAAKAGLSRRHTARLISEIFRSYLFPQGGFQEVMLTLRLSLASVLLTSGALSVTEVAQRVGYAYPESLTNAFKRAGLVSPTRVKGNEGNPVAS